MVFNSLPFPPIYLPHYLTPPSPFRRRTSSSGSTASTSSTSSVPSCSTSSSEQTYLTGHTSLIRCSRCHADLAFTSQIISKGFTGRYGRAYLVAPPSNSGTTDAASPSEDLLPNTFSHKAVPRHLVTGLHTVADISCMMCGVVLGWKYVSAEEEGQRYKVGKFILETKRCGVVSLWEGQSGPGVGGDEITRDGSMRWRRRDISAEHIEDDSSLPMPPNAGTDLAEEDIEFDSQDEEECEDLFAGVWTAESAMRRRRRFALRTAIL